MLNQAWVQIGMWLCVTITIYTAAINLYHRYSGSPFLHPLITTALVIFIALMLMGVSVSEYQQSTQILDWLLGPAIVALALPLYRQFAVIRALGWRVILPILIGGLLAPLLAWITIALFSNDIALQMTMLVKSITTPLAVEVAAIIGGIPPLAAGIVISTGIVGAVASQSLFNLFTIRSKVAQGIALGTVAHAIGTARALQLGETTAALATLSLCVNGITTAIVVPILF